MTRTYATHQFQIGQSPLWFDAFGASLRQKLRYSFAVFKYSLVRCSLLPYAASKCASPVIGRLKCVAFQVLGAFSLGDLLLGDGIISLVKENKNQNATK